MSVIYLDTTVFALLFGCIICLAAWEWSQFLGLRGTTLRLIYLSLAVACMVGSYAYRETAFAQILIWTAFVWWLLALVCVILEQVRGKNLLGSPPLKAIIGLLVLVPAWLSLVLLHAGESRLEHIALFLLVLIWTADSSAYFAGKRWGRSKLASKVSPGKTWEGVLGGLVGTFIIVLIYALVISMQAIEMSMFLFICLFTILVSVLGDLLESMMKRSVDLKDSGGLLPGHGGVLDRIDSLTAAAPVFFIGIWFMEKQF